MVKPLYGLGVAAMFVLALSFSACGSKQVYSPNPFQSYPKIQTVAVAPFIVQSAIATEPGGVAFGIDSYVDKSDGETIYYSTEFSSAFAQTLTNFPGLTVITPDRVVREWNASKVREKKAAMSEASGETSMKDPGAKETNPMQSLGEALSLARSLNADAVIVGEVLEWDPYEPRLTIDWRMHYTRAHSTSGDNIRVVESAGTGGGEHVSKNFATDAVYREQLSLDYNNARTQRLIDRYAHSLEEIRPYRHQNKALQQEPFPRFVKFAAWAAMSRAFSAYSR